MMCTRPAAISPLGARRPSSTRLSAARCSRNRRPSFDPDGRGGDVTRSSIALPTVAVAALLVLGLPAPRALGDSAAAAAKRHYEVGTAAYDLGEFVRAAEEYREAYRAKPQPALLYDIA